MDSTLHCVCVIWSVCTGVRLSCLLWWIVLILITWLLKREEWKDWPTKRPASTLNTTCENLTDIHNGSTYTRANLHTHTNQGWSNGGFWDDWECVWVPAVLDPAADCLDWQEESWGSHCWNQQASRTTANDRLNTCVVYTMYRKKQREPDEDLSKSYCTEYWCHALPFLYVCTVPFSDDETMQLKELPNKECIQHTHTTLLL